MARMNKALAAKVAAKGPSIRKVPFAEFGCVLHKTHKPRPSRVELHHRFPLYLQKQVWDDVDPNRPATAHDKERIPVCEGGHSDVHTAINALMVGGPIHRGIGRAELTEARETMRRVTNAQAQ